MSSGNESSAADENDVWPAPEDYLIPNRRPAAVRSAERSDKIIWNTVKRVAARAGVVCHVHALRAACAVRLDEAMPGELIGIFSVQSRRGAYGIRTRAAAVRGRNLPGD